MAREKEKRHTPLPRPCALCSGLFTWEGGWKGSSWLFPRNCEHLQIPETYIFFSISNHTPTSPTPRLSHHFSSMYKWYCLHTCFRWKTEPSLGSSTLTPLQPLQFPGLDRVRVGLQIPLCLNLSCLLTTTFRFCPIDALMNKAFSSSSFNSNTFLTRLLIHMGLLKVRLPVTSCGSLR